MPEQITDIELVDFINNRLGESRTHEVKSALKESVELQKRHAFLVSTMTSLNAAVSGSADRLDSSFLTDNIMRAVRNQAVKSSKIVVNEFVNWIGFVFKPVVTACVILIMVLATYNYISADQLDEEVSTAEAMLGLPPVTIASAYDVTY